MNEFESNSDAWNRERKFEAWNRECRSSIQVRCLELEKEEFEPISKLGIGNGGVSRQSSTLGIGNGGVRVLFRRWESGMEEFEQSSRLGIGNEQVRVKFRFLESGMEVRDLESGM